MKLPVVRVMRNQAYCEAWFDRFCETGGVAELASGAIVSSQYRAISSLHDLSHADIAQTLLVLQTQCKSIYHDIRQQQFFRDTKTLLNLGISPERYFKLSSAFFKTHTAASRKAPVKSRITRIDVLLDLSRSMGEARRFCLLLCRVLLKTFPYVRVLVVNEGVDNITEEFSVLTWHNVDRWLELYESSKTLKFSNHQVVVYRQSLQSSYKPGKVLIVSDALMGDEGGDIVYSIRGIKALDIEVYWLNPFLAMSHPKIDLPCYHGIIKELKGFLPAGTVPCLFDSIQTFLYS